MTIKTERVREISADQVVDELNRLVDRHNDMVADCLRCLALLSRHLAVARRKAAQFDALLEESNRLLHLAQRAQALEEENDHLWHVIADLDAELRERASK